MLNYSIAILILISSITCFAQDPAEYVRNHAVRFESPGKLNDSVFELLSPFSLIMVGEMHGTNEPAEFVNGLAKMFTAKGDSVQVGMEIPSQFMKKFLSEKTDSSVYKSEFFANPPFLDGRQSVAWANLIISLKNNPMVKLFFFDKDREEKIDQRDSIMYAKTKAQILKNVRYRTITLTGNAHNNTGNDNGNMGALLMNDYDLNLSDKLCSLNLLFVSGSMNINSGNGLEEKNVEYPESVISKAVPWDYYVMMANPAKNYTYTGIFFSRKISISKMVSK